MEVEIKRIAILFITFSIVFFLQAQDTWIQTYRPFQRENWSDTYTIGDIVVSQDGGYVISGTYELIGEAPWEYENWGFLMKTDEDGNILWVVPDSVEFMETNGYQVEFTNTNDGGYLSIGYQWFTYDSYMIKRDSEGNTEWAIPYNTDIGVQAIRTLLDGNIVMAGRSDYKAALRKITPEGETLWTQTYDVGNSIAYSLSITSEGGVILTGKINEDDNDVLVIKTDANGDSIWCWTTNEHDDDKGKCAIEYADQSIYVGGESDNVRNTGLLWHLDQSGNLIESFSLEQFSLWGVTSIINCSDDNIVMRGNRLVKVNCDIEEIWNEPINPYSTGDKNFIELDSGGFVCISRIDHGSEIALEKTNNTGQIVSINNNEIPFYNFTLNNYPNPFNPTTTISFSIPEESKVVLSIFNIKGQKIKSLLSDQIPAGEHSIVWNGEDFNGKKVSSGIYLYKLKTENHEETKKMILMK